MSGTMMNFDSDSFQLNPNYRLQFEEAQQCHVLLYPEGLVKLSETATEILKHCLAPTDAQALIATLQQTYPDADSLPDDVRAFLNEAQSLDWIVVVEK